MRVGIVGAGLQAKRRIQSFKSLDQTIVVVVSSDVEVQAAALATENKCDYELGWEWVSKRDDVDVILICTPPNLHEPIAIAAMKAGKHVLCEKPLSRTIEEGQRMIQVAKETGKTLKCGYNLRHHRAVKQARQMVDLGKIGKPLFVRSRYGICGHPGRESEWRFDPEQTSGGHLMDQGLHIIDLSRWFLGDFDQVISFCETQYWPYGNLEDNAFLVMRNREGKIASLHTSLMQWKNMFSFELFGEDGFLEIEGLGGSYGQEKLHYCKKSYDKPFHVESTEYEGSDTSWQDEWQEFTSAICEKRVPLGSAEDGLESMRLAFDAYKFSDQWVKGKTIGTKA